MKKNSIVTPKETREAGPGPWSGGECGLAGRLARVSEGTWVVYPWSADLLLIQDLFVPLIYCQDVLIIFPEYIFAYINTVFTVWATKAPTSPKAFKLFASNFNFNYFFTA